MKDGIVQQVGKPMELYEKPINKFVAGFIGSPQMNFYDVTLNGNVLTFQGGAKMTIPEAIANKLKSAPKQLIMGIRGEDIKVDENNLELQKNNVQHATVDDLEIMGNENNVYFNFGGTISVARVSKYDMTEGGETIDFVMMPSKMHFFDPKTEERIAL